jgi:chromosome segregation ATPase
MAEHIQTPEIDLEKTDRLPILADVLLDPDVEDDAVRMERPALSVAPGEFPRTSPVDLPSLAETVRSVEARIERQNAEYEALSRAFERARETEAAAIARAEATAKELAGTRALLATAENRSQQTDKALADRGAALELARSRAEEAVREMQRQHGETQGLRDSLATRDATIVQVLHSLGERDAQLASLQQQHASTVPALEARAKTATQLESELAAARARLDEGAAEFAAAQTSASALGASLKRAQIEVTAARSDLAAMRTESTTYLELLRSRDWRRGFNLNLFREMDARVGAADTCRDALQSERDQLHAQLTQHEQTVAAQSVELERLRSAAATQLGTFDQQQKDLRQADQERAQGLEKLACAEGESVRLRAELERVNQLQAGLAAQISELRSEAEERDQEMTVLMAHLQEARRPTESFQVDITRLKDELDAKSNAVQELAEEGRQLRATLERTRGALEEREFLIRRLERSESNNANALGRIQTSMERLGSAGAPNPAPVSPVVAECSAELIRIDGERSVSHALGRRTRIGRAQGCELQIDSSSVSRHHALILAGVRESIIEDLNSTNGVNVNGRKVTRAVLNDGDIVTIGEIQFRYATKAAPASP